MAVASFQDLCAGYCEIIKVTPPSLTADPQGRLAFHVVLRSTTVNLVYCPQESEEHLFVVFEFGSVGLEGAGSYDDLLALLEANFSLLRVYPPVFSRNPTTGEVLLQYVYPMFDATPHGLHELIERGFGYVDEWRNRATTDEQDPRGGPANGGNLRSPSLLDFA